jgi:transposase
MKAYSLDLRQKVVDAYACGDISQRKLAKNFRVTLSFVQNLLKRDRELGTISPKVRTEQTPTKLNAEQLEILRQLVTAQPDATLSELRERLYEKTEVLMGAMRFCEVRQEAEGRRQEARDRGSNAKK